MDSRTRIAFLLLFATLTGAGLHLQTVSPHTRLTSTIILLSVSLLLAAAIAIREPKAQNLMDALTGSMSRFLDIHPMQVALLLAGLTASLTARAAAGDGLLVHSGLATPLWLMGIALTVTGLWKREVHDSKSWATWEIMLLVGLFAAAFATRVYQVAELPYVLSGDEGSAGLTGVEFLDGRRNNLLSTAWFSFPALYFALLSISQRFFGADVFAIRAVSALTGALCIPALYGAIRTTLHGSRRFALLAVLWLAGFHHHIFFSRLAYNNIFDTLFFILALWGLWGGLRHGSRRAWMLFGAALGLGQYFYTTGRVTLLATTGAVALILIFRTQQRPTRGHLFAALALFLSVSLPLLLHYAANPELLTFTASRVSMLVPGWTGEAAAALGTTSFGLVVEQIWVTLLGLTTAELQGVYFEPGVPLLFGLSLPMFLAGVLLVLPRWKDVRLWAPALVFIGTILAGGLSIQAPNAQRMLLLPPLLALLCALPLELGTRWIERHIPRAASATTAIALTVILAAAVQNVLHLYQRYFPVERYGSLNGEVTYEMVDLLESIEPPQEIYFVGGERMSFAAIPSITYLLPEIEGIDIDAPYTFPPASDPGASKIIILLPEQRDALAHFTNRYTALTPEIRYNRDGDPLFIVLRVPTDVRVPRQPRGVSP